MSRFRNLGTITELCSLIEEIGFIPLFRCTIPGYSVEELTQDQAWWSDDPDTTPGLAKPHRHRRDNSLCKILQWKSWFHLTPLVSPFAAYRRSGMTFQQHREQVG